MSLPRVLIIGQAFNSTGGGITQANLFAGWEADKLAVACSTQQINTLNVDICKNYYQLGKDEIKWLFPFNFIERKHPSGVRDFTTPPQNDSSGRLSRTPGYLQAIRRTLIDKAFYPFLRFSGLYHCRTKTKISNSFYQWVHKFRPEVLYIQFSNLDGIMFARELHSQLKIPMVIHMMDDWLSTTVEKGLFRTYWANKIDSEFRNAIDEAKVLMSICEAMSEEYMQRYNSEFTPFRNPISLNNWLPFSKNCWELGPTFRVLYTGRIGRANGKSIMLISNVIDSLNQKGINFALDIYSPDYNTKEGCLLKNMKGVTVRNPVGHKEMPALLPSYDLLFLPLDFDEDAIRFARLSMPTKASEYMISGTPILVFADKNTALAKYASKYKWAYVLTDNNEKSLIDSLLELYSNQSLREELATTAKKTAIQFDDAEVVRRNFQSHFFKFINFI